MLLSSFINLFNMVFKREKVTYADKPQLSLHNCCFQWEDVFTDLQIDRSTQQHESDQQIHKSAVDSVLYVSLEKYFKSDEELLKINCKH